MPLVTTPAGQLYANPEGLRNQIRMKNASVPPAHGTRKDRGKSPECFLEAPPDSGREVPMPEPLSLRYSKVLSAGNHR
jgi:hypothetical protein